MKPTNRLWNVAMARIWHNGISLIHDARVEKKWRACGLDFDQLLNCVANHILPDSKINWSTGKKIDWPAVKKEYEK